MPATVNNVTAICWQQKHTTQARNTLLRQIKLNPLSTLLMRDGNWRYTSTHSLPQHKVSVSGNAHPPPPDWYYWVGSMGIPRSNMNILEKRKYFDSAGNRTQGGTAGSLFTVPTAVQICVT